MHEQRYDVIVAGAGTAGCVAARRAAAAGLRVLVVDADADALERGARPAAPMLRPAAEELGSLLHYDGTSPAWPLDRTDLDAAFDAAERMTGAPDGGLARFIAVRTGPALHEGDPDARVWTHRLRAAGLNPYAVPFGATGGLPPTGIERLHATVDRLETRSRGATVHALIVRRDGRELRLHGDVVILACGAIGSAGVLLRSTAQAHPNGLANGSGVVGRYLTRRNLGGLLALVKRPAPARFEPGIGIDDFRLRSAGWHYPAGHARVTGSSWHQSADGGAPYPGPTGVRGMHAIDLLLAAEGLPAAENRVVLARDGTPLVRYRPTNALALRKLAALLRHALLRVSMSSVLVPVAMLPDGARAVTDERYTGTVRMGTDPVRSAVDPTGRAHGIDNLFIADASTFPSGFAIDTELTVVANALRVADAAAARVGARPARAAAHRRAPAHRTGQLIAAAG